MVMKNQSTLLRPAGCQTRWDKVVLNTLCADRRHNLANIKCSTWVHDWDNQRNRRMTQVPYNKASWRKDGMLFTACIVPDAAKVTPYRNRLEGRRSRQ